LSSAFPGELEVPLVLAVQVGLDYFPSNLGRQDVPSPAILRDLLARIVETTIRTGTSNLAPALFARPLAMWMPAARARRGDDQGNSPLVQLT
jgi:hypothetical protein